MDELIFATQNQNKVKEVSSVLHGKFKVQSLLDLGIKQDIPEPYNTLTANAQEKARTVKIWTGKDCFSEDTGLMVDSLNGEPGVRSARYAGDHDFRKNIDKLLQHLAGVENRKARFLTVICLVFKGKEYIFEGECAGNILEERRGENGFGYDSIFVPEGSKKTFAQMDLDEKNKYSHRKKAVEKLMTFLMEQ